MLLNDTLFMNVPVPPELDGAQYCATAAFDNKSVMNKDLIIRCIFFYVKGFNVYAKCD
jgi:hypothetical protein